MILYDLDLRFSQKLKKYHGIGVPSRYGDAVHPFSILKSLGRTDTCPLPRVPVRVNYRMVVSSVYPVFSELVVCGVIPM